MWPGFKGEKIIGGGAKRRAADVGYGRFAACRDDDVFGMVGFAFDGDGFGVHEAGCAAYQGNPAFMQVVFVNTVQARDVGVAFVFEVCPVDMRLGLQ